MVIHISNIVIILFIIIFGMIICSRKKIFISKVYEHYFFLVFAWINVIHRSFDNEFWEISTFLILILLLNHFSKGIYNIYNVNELEIIVLLDKIFREIDIDFEINEKGVVLPDFNNASIIFRSTLGPIEINLKEIRNTKLYDEVKNRMKLKLKETAKDTFPYVGVIYILLGLVSFLIYYLHY